MTVSATEWYAEPRINLRGGYNDNINLTASPHDPVWETEISPSIKLGAATETDGITTDAGIAIRRYFGGSGNESPRELDREDYHLNTAAFHNTEEDRIGFNLDITRDSTQDAELSQGIITSDRTTRDRLTAGPTWTRALTSQTRLDSSYQFTRVTYSGDPGSSNLVDYDFHAVTATLTHQLTQRFQGKLDSAYTLYQPYTNFDSRSMSLQAGAFVNIDETLTASLLAGQRWIDSDTLINVGFCIGADPGAVFPSCTGGIAIPTGVGTGQVSSIGRVFSGSLTKNLDNASASVNVSRSASPGSNGELLDTTRLIIYGEYKFSEITKSFLKTEYTENQTLVDLQGQLGTGKRTYTLVTPGISWHWRREWTLSGEYNYALRDDTSTTATRNALYVTLTYQPPRKSLSR